MKLRLLILTSLIVSFLGGYSQVVINEYTAANYNDYANAAGDFKDWIELYNTGAAAANIGGYYLSDDITNPMKWQIPAAVSIPANGRMIFFASGDNGLFGTEYHTNFKLTQSKNEDLVLADAAGVILDQISPMQRLRSNHSAGRMTDGNATWGVFNNPTPNAANTGGFVGYMPKPVMDIAPGFYGAAQTVTITCSDPTAEIRYTTDGLNPTATSTLYTGPINVNATTAIRAAAYPTDPTYLRGFTETNTYFINVSHTMNVISVCGNYTSLFGGNDIVSSFELFDDDTPTHTFLHEGDGDMRPHGNDSWAFPQKGIRFFPRDEYGYENNIEHKIFNTSTRDEFNCLIIKAGASDNYPFATTQNGLQSCHLRDVFCQTLALEHGINLDGRKYEPCVLYVNGQYWGLYEMRERVDSDFTEYYYNQSKKDVDIIRFWGGLIVDEGSPADWNALYNYIMNNSMTVPANYAYVENELDFMSLIDNFILNTYVNNSDWLNWNTAWWRGRKDTPNTPKVKWKYWMWDQDNTWDLGENFTGLPSTGFQNDPCEVTNLPQFQNAGPNEGHVDIFNRLMMNDNFKAMYVNRLADLLNTTLSCDTLDAHFFRIVNRMTPEMPNQIARWGGSMAQWQANLVNIRDQWTGKCALIDTQAVDCYEVSGPFPITVGVTPPNSGTVTVSTLTPAAFPYTGEYFGGINLPFLATPGPGWMFDYWEVIQDTLLPAYTINDDSVAIYADSPATLIAHFKSLFGIINNDTSVCDGGNFVLVVQGGNNYNWTTTTSSTSLGTGQTLVVSPTATTSYICTSSVGADTVTITVNVTPQVSLGEDKQFCDVASSVITPQFAGGIPFGMTFSWQDGSATTTYNATTTGTYTLTVDNNGCSATDAADYVFSTTPSVNLGADVLDCNGLTGMNLDAGFVGGATYQWQDGSALSTYSVVNSGVYWVTVNNQGCIDRDTINIVLSQTPVVNLGPDAIICDGTAVVSLSAQYFPTATYLWQDGTSEPDYTVQVSGTYFVLADNQGCKASDTVSLIIGTPPAADLGPDRDLCPGKEIVLSVVQPQVNATWQDGSEYLQYYVKNPGTYYVEVVNTQGCINRDTVVITMSPLNTFELGNDVSICFGDSVVLNPVVPVGSVYLWSMNDAPNQPVTIKEAGVYEIEVIYEGCRVEDKMEVTVTDCKTCHVYTPSAFTPNGDGYNDVFSLGSNCQVGGAFSFSIYNRYGVKVFETASITEVWDGKVKGADAPEGVYTFRLDCNLIDEGTEKRFQQGGTITLVR